MRSYNSYESYRQYRKNRQRYETEVGIIPALLFFAILPKVLALLKILAIIIAVVVIVFACYKVFSKSKK